MVQRSKNRQADRSCSDMRERVEEGIIRDIRAVAARAVTRARTILTPALALLLLTALSAGVAAPAWAEGQSVGGEMSQPDAAKVLAGRSWRLVQIMSMDDTTYAPEDRSRYRLTFTADGGVQILADCNQGTGSWESTASGKLAFGRIAATQALCPPGSLHERYMAQFPWVRSYVMRDGNLFLATMADGSIIEFEPAPGDEVPASSEDGGPLNWEVTSAGGLRLRARPSTSASIVATLPAGSILDNFGCRRAGGRVWCDVQPFGGGPTGYVAAEYLQPAVGPDGSVATGPDDSALRAGRGEFDSTGKIPCAQAAGQPMGQCDFGVARHSGGFATIVVRKPDGMKRALFFRRGVAIGADTSEADGYHDFSATKEHDLHLIRVGPERYEVPDAVIFGG